MKLIVNEMPKMAQECMFSANGTGKYRCRHDAKLCPINRGGECPYLMAVEMAKPVEPEAPKKRTTKRSTAKSAE